VQNHAFSLSVTSSTLHLMIQCLSVWGITGFYKCDEYTVVCDVYLNTEINWNAWRLSAGVGTKIDPTLCRADRLVGQVLGAVGALPDIFIELEISYFLLRRLLGVRTEGDKKGAKVRRSWIIGARLVCLHRFQGAQSYLAFSVCFISFSSTLFNMWKTSTYNHENRWQNIQCMVTKNLKSQSSWNFAKQHF